MGMIKLRDALALMDQRDPNGRVVPFDLEHYTYNRRTHDGGDKVVLQGVRLHVSDAYPTHATMRANKLRPTYQKKEPRRTKLGLVDGRSNPAHFANTTRDVLLTDGAVHRFNIFLITRFNGDTVVL